MHRYFVTGTDTDVGKTRVVALLARALADAGHAPTIVKIAQTGLGRDEPGDARHAGALSGLPHRELARFTAASDPYNAALAQGAEPLTARDLAAGLARIDGTLVAEGSGGWMAPINANEHIGDVAAAARLETVLVVGLKLGCINHALLTASACERLAVPLAGAVLVDRWRSSPRAYAQDVVRALQGKMKIFGIVPFAADESASLSRNARLFDTLVRDGDDRFVE